MTATIALADRLDAPAILAMHDALVEHHDTKIAGAWRSGQVWIGSSSYGPHIADFAPPHHTRVAPAIDDLVCFLQTGRCFGLLRGGTADAPKPWLFADETTRFRRWYWPLEASITSDGQIGIFVAEMRERGPGYLQHTEPVATWLMVRRRHKSERTRRFDRRQSTAAADRGSGIGDTSVISSKQVAGIWFSKSNQWSMPPEPACRAVPTGTIPPPK